ncbi:DUF397 domain-containing protein [uncultured Streptomyces sp.]|uniref:DUF397 domain-containing protein n=1 Tax=uncultured Streptomyces sp. TaxID=174707 RepID=UPI002603945B|nr:DUF397 domain-containing protein [uncultured Streptomyces sp.]
MVNSLPRWISSTYSSPEGGNCVEWSPSCTGTTGVVPVRDSKRPAGPVLRVGPAAWAGLVALARADRRV